MGRKLESHESNVVDLGAFRRKVRAPSSAAPISLPIFYINQDGCSEGALRTFPFFEITPINSHAKFETAIALKKPGLAVPMLALIDAFLTWADPVELVRRLGEIPNCSVLLVYRPQDEIKNQAIFKRAFPLGLFDTLASPVTRDELIERLDILFRLNLRTSVE